MSKMEKDIETQSAIITNFITSCYEAGYTYAEAIDTLNITEKIVLEIAGKRFDKLRSEQDD